MKQNHLTFGHSLPYAQQFLRDVGRWIGSPKAWVANSVEECLKQWFQKKELTEYPAIPCLILWGIWFARNAQLFENKQVPTFQVFSQVYAILQGCRMDLKERIP